MSLEKSESSSQESGPAGSRGRNLENRAVPPKDSPDYALLANHKLFRNIPPQSIETLLAECAVQQLAQDEILISPDEENHHLYLLVSGRLQVCLDALGSDASFSIEPGECIGEMSIIEDRLTSAYVIAAEASSLVVLPEAVFWEQFVGLPGAARNLLQLLSQRMRRHNRLTLRSLEQQLRYEHLQRELEAAGKIQANILPKNLPLFPNHPQVDVYAMMEPAKEVGGDFFDAFALDQQRIYIAIGDVSGKGLPAALFMVRVMTLLRMSISGEAGFGSTLPAVNRMLCENNDECMFVTLFVGVLDVASGKLTYMNGGHNPPFFAVGDGPFEMAAMPTGMVLGISEEAPYEAAELTLHPGDTLVLYTDGVTEAANQQLDLFSFERAAGVLTGAARNDMTALVKTLQEAVIQFSGGAPQSDDITMLALRYRGDS